MSGHQEIDDIVGTVPTKSSSMGGMSSEDTIALVLQEVNNVLASTGDTLAAICADIEAATSWETCRQEFRRFNHILRMFLVAAPSGDIGQVVREAIYSLSPGDCFTAHLAGSSSVPEAIAAYKEDVLQKLDASIRRRRSVDIVSEQQDDELFARFLPASEELKDQGSGSRNDRSVDFSDIAATHAQKRGVSQVVDDPALSVIPKKKRSKVPALASIEDLLGSDSVSGAVKKRTLLTREKLRAGMHDPKGLLNLVGPSTNALDRTKKLELLKSAGYDFNSKGKSFSDKLNAATLRLDLGLGGHSVEDSILFGTKVLSLSGALSKKNISEVENNVVCGNTSWKHQDAYVRMIIAGCMNQAERIFEKYDEVLYGPSPEELIVKTHKVISDLLVSEDVQSFLGKEGTPDATSDPSRELLVKRIIEAVSPIIPVAIRNKSLDGSYFRTALQLLGAAELLFSRYVTDVRTQANPSGVVGMCNAMHSEFKRSAFYADELKPFPDFMKEMKAQYQTSLGLGDSFPNDKTTRDKRRAGNVNYSRGRSWQRSPRMGDIASRSSPGNQFTNYDNYGSGANFNSFNRGQPSSDPIRGRGGGRGNCFAFQAGTCRRGAGCRFNHPGH